MTTQLVRCPKAWYVSGVVLAILLPAGVAGGAGAFDESAAIFAGSAAADGVRMSYTSPGAPVTSTPIDSGGPTAQAFLSTNRGIRASAALPYPGDVFLAGPGTAAGFLGAAGVPLPSAAPEYPLIVTAEYPGSPERKVGDGPYALEAKAADNAAISSAGFGARPDDKTGVLRATSATSVLTDGGGVVASATSVFDGFTVGPLSFSQVTSTAEARLGADGQVSRSSSIKFIGAAVEGTPVALANDGAPAEIVPVVEAINAALTPSRMTLSVAPETEIPGGVVSPVLEVRSVLPGGGGMGEGTFALQIGRVAASVQTEATQVIAEPAPAVSSDESVGSGSPSSSSEAAITPVEGGWPEGSLPPVTLLDNAAMKSWPEARAAAQIGLGDADDTSAGYETDVSAAPSASPPSPGADSFVTAPPPLLASPASNGAGANTDLLAAYAVVAGLTVAGFVLSRVRKVSIPWNS